MTGGDAVAIVVRTELESLRQEALADPGAIDRFLAGRAFPLVEDRTCTFVYRGEADAVRLRHWVYGLPSTPAFTRLDGTDLYDWDKVTSLLAEQATWWEPGWKSGYHGISQGNLVGEVVRR